MTPRKNTTLHNLSKEIAIKIKDVIPKNTLSVTKISQAISSVFVSNPKELGALLNIHANLSESGLVGNQEKGLVAILYNQRDNYVNLAVYTHSNNSMVLVEGKDIELNLKDNKSLKKEVKLIQRMCDGTGLDIVWLKSEEPSIEKAEEHARKLIKEFPPHLSVVQFSLSFAEYEGDRSNSFYTNSDEMHPSLGALIQTHSYPYLPIQINYLTGNLNSSVMATSISSQNLICLSEGKIDNIYPKQDPLCMIKMNLLTQEFEDSTVLFDLLHQGIKHNWDFVESTYNFNGVFGNKKIKLDYKTYTSRYTVFTGGKEVKTLPVIEFDSNTKFDSNFFVSGHRSHTNSLSSKKIENISKSANTLLDKACEFQELLVSFDK